MRAAALVLVACGSTARPAAPEPSPPPSPKVAAVRVDPAAALEIVSESIELTADGHTVPGTLVHPVGSGRYAGIVLMAGSGPTDRDWNSPLLANKNGSGKLLAEALAKHGAVVLRFDKAAVGGNKAPLDQLSLDTYSDEARAALALLRTRPDVDAAHLFVAGHSEGGLHAIRVALAEGKAIAGLILLSTPGRTMKDVVLDQLEHQLRDAVPKQADAELASMRRALDDFIAGQDVDPKTASTLPPLQKLAAQFVAPQTAKLVRPMIAFDPARAVADVTVPVFVYNGLKDIQVDPERDAKRLEDALHAAHRDVTLFLAPDADHVLKHEPKSVADLRANLVAVEIGYNAPDRMLDDTTVAALVNWLSSSRR